MIQSKDQWRAAFLTACEKGDMVSLDKMLQEKCCKEWVNIHAIDDLGFRLACMNGHVNIMETLLNAEKLKMQGHEEVNLMKSSMMKPGREGLTVACFHGQLQAVKFLITSEVALNQSEWRKSLQENLEDGLRWAAKGNQSKVIEWLMIDSGLKMSSEVMDIQKEYDHVKVIGRAIHEKQILQETIRLGERHELKEEDKKNSAYLRAEGGELDRVILNGRATKKAKKL